MWVISDEEGRLLLWDCIFSTAEKAIQCVVGHMASAYSSFEYSKLYHDESRTFTIHLINANINKCFYVREIPVDITIS